MSKSVVSLQSPTASRAMNPSIEAHQPGAIRFRLGGGKRGYRMIWCDMDSDLLVRVDREAKRRGVCRGALVREYLERGLDAKAA